MKTTKLILSVVFLWITILLNIASVRCGEVASVDFGEDSMRYLTNDRIKFGIDLSIGGAVTFLSDKENGGENMINSADWGRQIQLSFYSGPNPFIGPNGEKPTERWAGLGWNPIQSGDVGGNKSKTTFFEYHGNDTMVVRCIPMQWPHDGVPGDCEFECKYTLKDNVIHLKASIINNRKDKTQYAACGQEMPALYTNGPWYKLISYIGDNPFHNEATTVLVDKNDGKGWPWVHFATPEGWAALVDDNGRGIGVFQPDSIRMTAGFHGGDANKGHGGEKGGQTGYIAPLGHQILDHNITWSYQTYFILGTVDDIRGFVYKTNTKKDFTPKWSFEDSRADWYYGGAAKDTGWPIKECLDITFAENSQLISPITFWKSSNAQILEIEGSFELQAVGNQASKLTLKIQPFGPSDCTDWLGWSEGSQSVENEKKIKADKYPVAKLLEYTLDIVPDNTRRVYQIDLSSNPEYKGAMKQLQIEFPQSVGAAKISRIEFKPLPKSQ
ncbi:MAG: hypothetical protein ACRC2T_11685 [Thermoguttaceae bacterium]